MADPKPTGCCCCSTNPNARRGFLSKLGAAGLGLIALAGPVGAAIASFLSPLRQKGQATKAVKLAQLDSLDAAPRKFTVIMDRTDAWSRYPKEPVGAVFLRKLSSQEMQERGTDVPVEAIHVVCPHAGCFIEYNASGNAFYCPCHNGHFDLAGRRTDATSPSPRDLDTLPVEIRENEVWVEFQNFKTGRADRVPV